MIIVKGRELLIPENERYLGTNYDTGMENRVFRIPRLSQSGTDLSDLKFNVNLIFNSEPLDIAELQKSVDDDYIYLTWTVTAVQVSVTGTVFVCVTGNDTNDTVKWSSFRAPFYTEKSLGEDVETEYKQVIEKVNQEIEDRKSADAAEKNERETAINAEINARQSADAELQSAISSEVNVRQSTDMDLQNAISSETSSRAEQDAILSARMDVFARLPEGSTTGDAELQDIRVGADGVTYPTAGNAVRANDKNVNDALNGIFTFTNASNPLEIGSFTGEGLNASATNRIRSKGYYPVKPNTDYYLGYSFNVAGTYGQSSVSFYATNDFTTPRMSAEAWTSTTGGHKFTTPDGCYYVRLLFKRGNDSNMSLSDYTGVYIYDYTFNTAFVKRLEYSLVAVTNPDLNNLTEYRYYTISGQLENMSNIPETAPYENSLLEVYKYPNGAILQRLMYTISGATYERLKGTDNVWRAWAEVGPRSYSVQYLTNPDLNDLTVYRYYSITGNDLDTTHNPVKLYENRVLEVIPYPNGAVFQRLTYTHTGQVYTRLKGTDGVWRAWSRVNSPVVKFIYYAPVPSEFALNNYVPRDETTQGGGDIAFYNNKMFGFSPLHMYVDGNDIAISNGHGNNCMFGTEVHGTYPYLYCASWDKDDCRIFVNRVTETSAALVRTISYPTLNGYLNACVDEPNDKIYILLCVSDTTYEGEIRFVVSDLNGNIESNTAIEDIPIVQGMTFYKGYIYVLSGDGSTTYPNTLTILDTNGSVISKSDHATMWGEFEGIDIYNGTMYIATRDSIFNN